jgi:ABC-type transport system substrate-binding protein
LEGDSLDLKPCLATKWDISPDGKVYTFHLRKGVKFYPSGDPFNAQTAKFTFDTAFGGESTAPVDLFGTGDWIQFDRCEIVDDYTIKLHLKRPLAWFIRMTTYIGTGGMINPKFVNAHGGVPKARVKWILTSLITRILLQHMWSRSLNQATE